VPDREVGQSLLLSAVINLQPTGFIRCRHSLCTRLPAVSATNQPFPTLSSSQLFGVAGGSLIPTRRSVCELHYRQGNHALGVRRFAASVVDLPGWATRGMDLAQRDLANGTWSRENAANACAER
jgi:hypothetical protein